MTQGTRERVGNFSLCNMDGQPKHIGIDDVLRSAWEDTGIASMIGGLHRHPVPFLLAFAEIPEKVYVDLLEILRVMFSSCNVPSSFSLDKKMLARHYL